MLKFFLILGVRFRKDFLDETIFCLQRQLFKQKETGLNSLHGPGFNFSIFIVSQISIYLQNRVWQDS